MIDETLRRLREVELLEVGPPLAPPVDADPAFGVLPPDLRAVLRQANGFMVHAGMNRLFGVRPEPHLDLRAWNSEQRWLFAWDERVSPYHIIGETAFGDLYALRRRPEGGEGFEAAVYFLEGNFLQPEVIAPSVDEWLREEFLRNALQPYDPVAVAAVERFGRVPASKNLVFAPSVALGGPENVQNLMVLDCFTAMIYAGDVAVALETAADDAVVAGVRPWFDEHDRPRLAVQFAA